MNGKSCWSGGSCVSQILEVFAVLPFWYTNFKSGVGKQLEWPKDSRPFVCSFDVVGVDFEDCATT